MVQRADRGGTTGPLDLIALQRDLQAIVVRHEVLRTTFGTVQGEPVQQLVMGFFFLLGSVTYCYLSHKSLWLQ